MSWQGLSRHGLERSSGSKISKQGKIISVAHCLTSVRKVLLETPSESKKVKGSHRDMHMYKFEFESPEHMHIHMFICAVHIYVCVCVCVCVCA